MRANLRAIAQAASENPTQALLDAAGNLADYEMFHNNVLVATYVRPEKTAGGVLLPDRSLAEDRFQGKVGLVLGWGPLAFKDDSVAKFGGVEIKVGDWVIYRPSDALEYFIRDRRTTGDGLPCRVIEDSLIKGRVADPSLIY